jgi:hypothetical protein
MSDVKDKIIQASKVYGDQTVIRALINAIPYIGSSIDILLSSSGQSFISKRIEKFIEELNRQVLQLSDDKINKDFLNTEEGFDLIVKAFSSASRTRQHEKLKLYSKIVKGALTEGKEFEEDDPEIYLRIIEELTVKELRVAKHLYELKEVKKRNPDTDSNNENEDEGMSSDAFWLSKNYPEFDKDELVSIFVRLEKTGLIKELVGSFLGYGGGEYLINTTFRKFMNFVDGLED